VGLKSLKSLNLTNVYPNNNNNNNNNNNKKKNNKVKSIPLELYELAGNYKIPPRDFVSLLQKYTKKKCQNLLQKAHSEQNVGPVGDSMQALIRDV
jgi:hypothetical protein